MAEKDKHRIIMEILFYIEFDKSDPDGSSEAVSYFLSYVPRIGETVCFNETTYSKFENGVSGKYMIKDKTRLHNYNKVVDVQYNIDDNTIIVALGLKNK